jgi:uncharacterized protein (TIGR01777 family)
MLKQPPRVFLSTSAVGYYGNQGEAFCTETTPCGTGFLADVCKEWESALTPVIARGVRTPILRSGIVLAPHGGVLKQLLLPFSWGLGGVVGSGKQYMSWIAMADWLEAALFVLEQETMAGPINLVAPVPVTNAEFTRTLAKAVRRPALLPAPAFLLRLVLGREKADQLLLSSIRAMPARLQEAGFVFRYPTLEQLLHCS